MLYKHHVPTEVIWYIILSGQNHRLFDRFQISIKTFGSTSAQKLQRLGGKKKIWHSGGEEERSIDGIPPHEKP